MFQRHSKQCKCTNNIILVEKSNKNDLSISVRNGQMSQKWNHQTLGWTYTIFLLTFNHNVRSCRLLIGPNDFFEFFAMHPLWQIAGTDWWHQVHRLGSHHQVQLLSKTKKNSSSTTIIRCILISNKSRARDKWETDASILLILV